MCDLGITFILFCVCLLFGLCQSSLSTDVVNWSVIVSFSGHFHLFLEGNSVCTCSLDVFYRLFALLVDFVLVFF